MSTHTSWRVRQELRLDNHCSVDCSSDCSGDALAPVSTDWARPAAALSSMSQPPAASRPPAEPRLPIVLTRWHASARSRPPLHTPPAPPPLPSTPAAHTSPAQTARARRCQCECVRRWHLQSQAPGYWSQADTSGISILAEVAPPPLPPPSPCHLLWHQKCTFLQTQLGQTAPGPWAGLAQAGRCYNVFILNY